MTNTGLRMLQKKMMMTGMLQVSFPVLPIFKLLEQGHLLFNYFFVLNLYFNGYKA